MKTSGTNTRWGYSDSLWFDNNLLNANSTANLNIDIKTQAYISLPFTSVRLSLGTISNYIKETTWSSTNFLSFMLNGTKSSTNTRSTWINWINNAVGNNYSWISNCNQFGTNGIYNYQDYRLGGVFNQENDCLSVDEVIGFGLQGISPYSESIASGSFSSYNGSGIVNKPGWIFIK